MSIGICKVNPHILAKALHMPEGTVIETAQWDIVEGLLLLRVQHPDIPPQREGYPFQGVHVLVTETVDTTSPDRVARSYEGEWK